MWLLSLHPTVEKVAAEMSTCMQGVRQQRLAGTHNHANAACKCPLPTCGIAHCYGRSRLAELEGSGRQQLHAAAQQPRGQQQAPRSGRARHHKVAWQQRAEQGATHGADASHCKDDAGHWLRAAQRTDAQLGGGREDGLKRVCGEGGRDGREFGHLVEVRLQ